jgi:photosystem II stability/assembly factor-like uncharacterized protein
MLREGTPTVVPPEQSPDELEALIREARERQRRRRLLLVGGVALAAAAVLSVRAAIPSRGGSGQTGNGAPAAGASRALDDAGRIPIAEVGTSGGVTWAINGRGMWLTSDGGRTWRASLPPRVAAMGDAVARVEQVQFLDRRHGWLLAVDVRGGRRSSARHAELDWTSDGGRTWHWTMPAGCCGPLSFVDRRRGFFVGATRLYATRDGGTRWNPVGGRFEGGPLTFVDVRHGVSLLDGGFLRTADGGRHWTAPLLSGQPPSAGNGLLVGPPVAVFGHRLVMAGERDVHFPKVTRPDAWRVIVYVSDDGGATWLARPLPRWWIPYIGSNDGNRFSAGSATAWVAAARQELVATTDAGRTWRLVRPRGIPNRWVVGAIDFTSARVGWAIFNGPHQNVLMRTTDGGLRWKPAGPRRPRHHKRG